MTFEEFIITRVSHIELMSVLSFLTLVFIAVTVFLKK